MNGILGLVNGSRCAERLPSFWIRPRLCTYHGRHPPCTHLRHTTLPTLVDISPIYLQVVVARDRKRRHIVVAGCTPRHSRMHLNNPWPPTPVDHAGRAPFPFQDRTGHPLISSLPCNRNRTINYVLSGVLHLQCQYRIFRCVCARTAPGLSSHSYNSLQVVRRLPQTDQRIRRSPTRHRTQRVKAVVSALAPSHPSPSPVVKSLSRLRSALFQPAILMSTSA